MNTWICLQLGDAAEGSAEHFPRQQIVVGFKQGFQGLVQILAADGAGDGGLDARIQADFDPGAGELFQNFDQGSFFGLKPEPVAIQAEIEGRKPVHRGKERTTEENTSISRNFRHKTA